MSQLQTGTNRDPVYSTPRWVKVFGIALIILILLVAVMLVIGRGGEHGPGRHTAPIEQESQPQGPAGYTPPIQHGGQ